MNMKVADVWLVIPSSGSSNPPGVVVAGLPGQVLLRFWVPEVAAALEGSEQWVQGLDADAGTREGFKAALDQAWTLSLDSRGD